MNLEEELKDTIYKIITEVKEGKREYFECTIKELERDPDRFIVFFNIIMDLPDNLTYRLYKSLLAPLNILGFSQEVLKLYIKIISTLMEDREEGNILDFVNLLYSLPASALKTIFSSPSSSCFTTSLIMFGEFLFFKKWHYESYKVLYIASQGITLTGLTPTKEIMVRYLNLICIFFLKSSNYFSFFNAFYKLSKLDKQQIDQFGSKKQFQSLIDYYKVKNEGAEYTQLLYKSPLLSDNQIQEFVNEIKSTNEDGLIKKYVDFSKWNIYLKTVGQEIDYHDFSFISFLKKNNFVYKVTGKKVSVGEYKFKSISDVIFDIVDLYKPKREVVKDKKVPLTLKKTVDPVGKVVQKNKTRKFKDNFSGKKAKFVIFCDILSKTFKEIDLKFDIRDTNRLERFKNKQKVEEQKRKRLREYYDTVVELKQLLTDKMKKKEEVYEPRTQNKPIQKTNWRDIEEDSTRPTGVYRNTSYGDYNKTRNNQESNVLSSRVISSFDGVQSSTSVETDGVYVPPHLSKPKGPVRSHNETGYRKPTFSFSQPTEEADVYVPPHLKSKTSQQKKGWWYDDIENNSTNKN